MTRSRPPLTRLAHVCAAFALAAGCLAGCDSESNQTDDESEAAESKRAAESTDPPDAASGSEATDETSDDSEGAEEAKADETPAYLTGRVTPGRVTEVFERWRKRIDDVEVDKSDARALGEVAPGAEVTVYFATWCPDSRREVPRLWKALRSAGGDVPFSVDYIALDHDFEAGDVSIEGADVHYVPTFVVERDGEEVGRIVETSPTKLEKDLHALLAGEKEGVLTTRDDL